MISVMEQPLVSHIHFIWTKSLFLCG